MNAIAFDTETGGLNWFESSQQAFLVTWATADGTFHADLSSGPVGHFLSDVMGADLIIGHNLKFDIHHVRAALDFNVLTWATANHVPLWDTDLTDRVLHPTGQREDRGGHGLKELDAIYLDGLAKQYEDELKTLADRLGISLKSTPHAYRLIYEAFPEEMIKYARHDARATFDIAMLQQAELRAAPDNLRQVVKLEHDVLPILIRAEQRGVAVDQDQVITFKRKFDAEARRLETSITTTLGDGVLGGEGSVARLEEALLKHGVPLTERTPSDDRYSMDKRVLTPLAGEYPIIDDILEYRKYERFLTTYIGPMVDRTVIHTDFQQAEAWTGRMSSRRPNMQNWPQRAGKEVRNVLKARPGHKLIVADYSQMEAMIIAYYLNDAGLIEAMENGLDMNAWMAAQIWGGEVDDWRKDGPKAEGEQSRKTARHTLYATAYGAGGRRVTQQLPFLDRGPWLEPNSAVIRAARARGRLWPKPGWQYAEARALINKVKASLPGWYDFNDRLKSKIKQVGYVNTIYGRQNPIPVDKMYVAVAGIVQGSGADLMKLGAVAAAKALESFDAQLLMFVHDELVAEAREDVAVEALAVMQHAMENAYIMHPLLKTSGAILDRYGED